MAIAIDMQLLGAFVDGALERGQHDAVHESIHHDQVLQAHARSLRCLCAAVRKHAERHAAPGSLRLRSR